MVARSESGRGSRIIKVVVADSSALFRAGMRRAIEAEPDLRVVGEADRAEQLADVAAACRPDVIVLGSMTQPGVAAVRRSLAGGWTREPRRYLDDVKAWMELRVAENVPGDTGKRSALVALLDTGDGGRDVLDAVMDMFAAGVCCCLDRSADPGDLICAIRAAFRGRRFVSSLVLKVLVDGLARLREVASGFEEAVVHAMTVPSKAGSQIYTAVSESCGPILTAREREVLSLVARGKSNRDIASMLSISEKTVKNHVSHLLHKLGADRRTQAAIWAISQGLSGPTGSQDIGSMTKVPLKNESSG